VFKRTVNPLSGQENPLSSSDPFVFKP